MLIHAQSWHLSLIAFALWAAFSRPDTAILDFAQTDMAEIVKISMHL
jgi:hypothetical protein